MAGSCVLGSQSLLIGESVGAALAFWIVGVLAWTGLTYTIFTAFTVKQDKPGLAEGINGGWLLAVVATQAISVLIALLATYADQPARVEMNFLALSMCLWGGMLYIWMMGLIFYRYTFFAFSPSDLAPRLSPASVCLRSALLGAGLPRRDVHGCDPADGRRHGTVLPAHTSAVLYLCRPVRLGLCVHRSAARSARRLRSLAGTDA